MGCKKAQGFLEAGKWKIGSQSDASKEKRGEKQALELARQVDKIIVGKGKKTVTFDMKKDPPDASTLLASMLGPTGNLRAPTIRRGKTLLVGFQDQAYREYLAN